MPDYRKGDGSILRPELTDRPLNMLYLPIVRGYPVPWFVDWIDHVPEFRAMDHSKIGQAIREHLCWVCGRTTGRYLTFVAGPMCGINRVSAEPPCHRDCGRWSAINCPFLNNPEFDRRETAMPNNIVPMAAAGIMIRRNPGVTMLWTCRNYSIMPVRQRGAQEGILFMFGEPTSVEWFSRGRKASRVEVMQSVLTGYPLLLDQCENAESRKQLDSMAVAFDRYVPA